MSASAPWGCRPSPSTIRWCGRSIFICVILGGKDAQVFANQVREMADREFEYFVERMAGRGLTGRTPPNREATRKWPLAMMDGVMMG